MNRVESVVNPPAAGCCSMLSAGRERPAGDLAAGLLLAVLLGTPAAGPPPAPRVLSPSRSWWFSGRTRILGHVVSSQ